MATLDKEIKVIAVKGQKGDNGQDGKSSYELAVEELHYSGTLEEWLESFATPENYVTRNEFRKVTQAEYDELEQAGELIPDCYYIITDDTSYDDMIDRIEDIETGFSELEANVEDFEEEVRNAIERGTKLSLTSIECACDFSYWNSRPADDYSPNANMTKIDLDYGANFGNNRVNIFPIDCKSSIAEAKVEYVSGDDGYILYSLDSVENDNFYISFSARNISSTTIYSPNHISTSAPSKSTTFRIYVKDVYGNEFTKEFTILYKAV